MQRYYYHLDDDGRLTFDREGLSLADDVGARNEAIRGIRDIVAEELRRTGLVDLNRSLHVCRSDEMLVHLIAFTDVITVVSTDD